MTDEQWTRYFQDYVYVKSIERKTQEAMLEKTFKASLYEVATDIFKAINKSQEKA